MVWILRGHEGADRGGGRHCASAGDQLVVDTKPEGEAVDGVWMENEKLQMV